MGQCIQIFVYHLLLSIYGIIEHIDLESYAVSIDHPLLHEASLLSLEHSD